MRLEFEHYSGRPTPAEERAAQILASLPREIAAYGSSLTVSSLEPYPGYQGSVEVFGNTEDMGVAGYPDDNTLRVVASFTGMPPRGAGTVRVHEGYSCDTAGGVMVNPITGEDPWGNIFLAGQDGSASVSQVADPLPLSSVVGRTFVVSGNDGQRAACGVLGMESAGMRDHGAHVR